MIKSRKDLSAIVEQSAILKELEPFQALWVGTIPIEVHIETSDIDIICFYEEQLPHMIKSKFGEREGFSINVVNDSLVAKFRFMDVAFEIYAEMLDPRKQLGYLHMIAEENLLKLHGEPLREKVRTLKRQGLKTEPAFAEALGVEGDPYLELLKFVNM